jgi:hypothetical protein
MDMKMLIKTKTLINTREPMKTKKLIKMKTLINTQAPV